MDKNVSRETPITAEQFESICSHIETSADGVYKTCREIAHISTTDFYTYIRDKGEVAALRYARAKELQCDNMADHMEDIADTCEDANKARLQVDTRKWYLSKIKPKRYGDHQQIEIVQSMTRFTEAVIAVVKLYVPEDKQSEAIGKIQASIDFND